MTNSYAVDCLKVNLKRLLENKEQDENFILSSEINLKNLKDSVGQAIRRIADIEQKIKILEDMS